MASSLRSCYCCGLRSEGILSQIQQHIDDKSTIEAFLQDADLNANAHLIKGVICGYRIEEIDNELTRQARYFDTLIEE